MGSDATWACTTFFEWSTVVVGSGGDEYAVAYDRISGWRCSCPAGRYGKACKHVEEARLRWCGWTWDGSREDAPSVDGAGRYTCPRCGQPLEATEGRTP